MKKIVFICLLLISSCCFAQDTIVTKNNEVIVAAISEVSATAIRYKKFDMPGGPDFIVDKSTLKKITYKNGTIENIDQPQQQPAQQPLPGMAKQSSKTSYIVPGAKFVKEGKQYTYNGNIVGEGRMYKIMYQTKDEELKAIAKKAKKAKGLQFIGFGAILAATYPIDVIIASKTSPDFNEAYTKGERIGIITAGTVATVGLAATGLVFVVRHKTMKAKAVKLYNEKY